MQYTGFPVLVILKNLVLLLLIPHSQGENMIIYWKNLLFFAFSSLSVCVYTRARLNVIAHATKVNSGIKKKRGSCGKVNSLSVFLGCVLVVRALGDCSLFLRKNPAKAPPTKKIEICRNTFFRRVTQTHTQTYTQTMTCK